LPRYAFAVSSGLNNCGSFQKKKSQQRRPTGASGDVAEILSTGSFPDLVRGWGQFHFSEGPL